MKFRLLGAVFLALVVASVYLTYAVEALQAREK